MNNTIVSKRLPLLLVSASVLLVAALWWAGEVRATAVPPPGVASPEAPSVQDSEPKIDLDTKIFLHRNARIVTSLELAARA
jgi:hypothetical protein